MFLNFKFFPLLNNEKSGLQITLVKNFFLKAINTQLSSKMLIAMQIVTAV